MIYRVVLDGVDIYGTVEGRQIIKGTCDLELNGAGSCEITIPYNHEAYDLVEPMASSLEIIEDDTIIWFGRVINISTNWNKDKKITAEGALTYFNESILRPYTWSNVGIRTFFEDIIARHNDLVPAKKRFTVGTVEFDDTLKVTRTVNYMKTFDIIQDQCLKAVGGYIFLRKELDDNVWVQYIDWYKEPPYNSGQDIEFGINLLDLNTEFTGEDILTAVIPLGDDGNGGKVPITGSTTDEPGYSIVDDYIVCDEAEEAYGLITEVIEFNDVDNKSILVDEGIKYLKNKQFDHLSFECDVAELKYLNNDLSAFQVGQNVHVYSDPHLIDKDFVISKISYDISNASKKITVGTPPRQDLSQISASNGSSSGTVISGGSGSGGGGGGGGGGSTVSVNPIILTGDDIATITVNGRVYYLRYDASSKADVSSVYTKSQVDNALNDKADKLTTYTKTEVDTALTYKADKSTTYTKSEVDDALYLKADKSDTYTKTEVDEALELRATKLEVHDAKFKVVSFHNRNSITLGNTTTQTTHRTKLIDEDFATDSRSPLAIELQVKLNSEMLAFRSTTIDGYPSVTIYDPSVIGFEFVLNTQTLDFYPEQVLEPGKNSLFFKCEIQSIDTQMHNLKIYIRLKDGKINIGQGEAQLIISGTGVDAEGYSGVAVAADNVSLLNVTNLFIAYDDEGDAEPIDVYPDEDFEDDISVFNITNLFGGFTDNPEVTTEIPEVEEGDT